MDVIIRADASVLIGTGHVMRCLTLAEMLRKHGHSVSFISRDLPGNLINIISNEGYNVTVLPFNDKKTYQEHSPTDDYALWLGVDMDQDARDTIEHLGAQNCDLLVVDHYGIDERWEKLLIPHTSKLMVIDDLANRPHACDILLDHNYYENLEDRYEALVPKECKKLLGPKYALINSGLRKVKRERECLEKTLEPEEIQRIIVFLGGVDANNYTQQALDYILGHQQLQQATVDVVLGAVNSYKEVLKRTYAAYDNIVFHVQPPYYFDLLAQADLAIGAGGVSQLERMYIGLPTIVISTAENQEAIVKNAMGLAGVYTMSSFEVAPKDKLKPEISLLNIQLIEDLFERDITIITPSEGWFYSYAIKLKQQLSDDFKVVLTDSHKKIKASTICFYLSYPKIVPEGYLGLASHNIVVHASDLPQGKGWSPWVWEIEYGNDNLVLSLFEVVPALDAGPIYFKKQLTLDGTELLPEIREKLGKQIIDMCLQYAHHYDELIATEQIGESSYYSRRKPEHNQLELSKSLADQFNKLRVADNQCYPAYFNFLGHRYILTVEKSYNNK
ncbi:MAG: UDP-2,4-diacetamido-2,4,6-trideoxy-beta-L-altropyranose hydrolase [Chlamydiota bacterium]